MKAPDLDTDLPALVPELIAEQVTQDETVQAKLCSRARRHWKTVAGFRKSFVRKDERAVLRMWFDHWLPRMGPMSDRLPPAPDTYSVIE